MPTGIYIRTEAHRKAMSKAMKGGTHFVSKTTKEKIRQSHLGIKLSEDHKQKISESHKNPSLETRKRMSISVKGKILSDSTKRRMKKNHKGMLDKHHSEETREKISKAFQGNKHPNWQGGISKFPYSQDWTEVLKKAIRKRDGYKCRLCGKTQKQESRKLDIHHTDYNKENCDPKNLISLCRSCNSKVNGNRKAWTKFFQLKLKLKTG